MLVDMMSILADIVVCAVLCTGRDRRDEIARHWNIEPHRMPQWAESPTHIMQMLQYIEQGSIEMLWVIGTNPLVSLPDLNRIRRLLTQPQLFLVVQDGFMTESAQLADLVLPAAIWAEKTVRYSGTAIMVTATYMSDWC